MVGVGDGLCVVGVGDGVRVVGVGDGARVVGSRVGVGVQVGWTAAPWSVSRSNSVSGAVTPNMYAAQIRAGKPPPLTRGSPPALYIGTCACGGLSSSPNRPTDVTRSGV